MSRKILIGLAAGVITAGGTLGILIPPSTVMVIYGIMTQTNIGKLFAAGILPGLLMTLLLCLAVMWVVTRHPEMAARSERQGWGQRLRALREIWGVVLLFGLAGEKNGGIVRRAPNGDPIERPRVKVDIIGIGAGVYAILKRNPFLDVFAVNVAERATAEPKPGQSRFHRLRDQVWFAARDFLKDGGGLPPKLVKLRSDLLAPKSNVNAEGHVLVESKAEIKKRLGRSPDIGDAFCLCVYEPPPPARVEQGQLPPRRW